MTTQPTVQTYLDWARAQNCAIDLAAIERDARLFQIVQIRAPSGASVTEIVSELHDPLMSTTIARLDRRLGLKSHLFR